MSFVWGVCNIMCTMQYIIITLLGIITHVFCILLIIDMAIDINVTCLIQIILTVKLVVY